MLRSSKPFKSTESMAPPKATSSTTSDTTTSSTATAGQKGSRRSSTTAPTNTTSGNTSSGIDQNILQAIRAAVHSEVSSAFESHVASLHRKLDQALGELADIRTTVSHIENGLQDCSSRVDTIHQDFLPRIDKQINDIATALCFRQIDMDQHSRKWSLIVQGVKGAAHEPQETTRKACLTMARDSLKIQDAEKTPLAACHRLRQTEDAPVIIRFVDLADRDKWLSNAKLLRHCPDKISISPDISPVLRPLRNEIMDTRRKLPNDLKQKSSVKYLQSWPYMELRVNGTRHSDPAIKKCDIAQKYLNTDLNINFEFSA